MAIQVAGNGGVVAEVDNSTTRALRSRLFGPSGALDSASGGDVRTASGLMIGGSNDGNGRVARMDRTGGIATTVVSPLMWEPFEGTTISANRLVATATTMAAAQTALGLTINSAAITTINTGIFYATRKLFPRIMRAPLQCRIRARLAMQANAIAEFGFGSGNTAAASPNVGAYFQVTAAGVLQPVVTFNGVDTTGTSITYSTSNYYTFDVIMDDDFCTFVVQDTSTGLFVSEQTIKLPLTQARISNVTHLPAFFGLRTTGTAPASAPSMIVTDLFVGVLDSNINTPWAQRMAAMGNHSGYNPSTFATNTNNANSTAPTNATLSNTAAGYATIDGRFGFAAVAGAVTDYALFAITVPSPYQFVMTGIDIETYNTGAAVATTPTLLDWSVGVNGASVNLSTGGHIRKFVGAQQFAVAAAIGAKAERISQPNFGPIVCEAGLSFVVILRMPVGTATASQVIQGGVTVHGYFE